MDIQIDRPFHNQLLFNLDVPLGLGEARYHRPKPIVIEKLTNPSQKPVDAKEPFQFQYVSEERLSQAMRLARRDIRHQRESITLQSLRSLDGEQENVTKPKEKVAVVAKPTEKAKKFPIPNWRPAGASGINPKLPARGDSPPSRDKGGTRVQPGTHNTTDKQTKILDDIKRLRVELDACTQQALVIEQRALQGIFPVGRMPPRDEPREETLRKCRLRADQFNTRSTRQLYALQRQVRDLLEELVRDGQEKPRTANQMARLNRLGSMHRSAHHLFQALIGALPDFDLRQGLPALYRDLQTLLRQLTLCCAQVEVILTDRLPSSIVHLVQDVAELNNILEEELRATSPSRNRRLCQPAQHGSPYIKPHPRVGFEQAGQFAEGHMASLAPDIARMSPYQQQEFDGTAQETRRRMLRDGISTLLRDEHNPRADTRPPWSMDDRPVPGRRAVLGERNGPRKPGMMAKNAANRPRSAPISHKNRQRTRPHGYYMKPTRASRSKVVPLHHAAAAGSRLSRIDDRSMPRSPRSHSIESFLPRQEQPGFDRLRQDPRLDDFHLDIARQVNEDQAKENRLTELEAREQAHRDELTKLKKLVEEEKKANSKKSCEPLVVRVEVDQEDLDLQTGLMHAAPSLHQMLRKLEDMEKEQGEIRQRWATIVYEDEHRLRKQTFDEILKEPTETPPPIEVSSGQTQLPPPKLDRTEAPFQLSSIRFTKPRSADAGNLGPASKTSVSAKARALLMPKIELSLTKREIENIHQNRTRFCQYLSRLDLKEQQGFNPWSLSANLADDILDDCVGHVAKDLYDFSRANRTQHAESPQERRRVDLKPDSRVAFMEIVSKSLDQLEESKRATGGDYAESEERKREDWNERDNRGENHELKGKELTIETAGLKEIDYTGDAPQQKENRRLEELVEENEEDISQSIVKENGLASARTSDEYSEDENSKRSADRESLTSRSEGSSRKGSAKERSQEEKTKSSASADNNYSDEFEDESFSQST